MLRWLVKPDQLLGENYENLKNGTWDSLANIRLTVYHLSKDRNDFDDPNRNDFDDPNISSSRGDLSSRQNRSSRTTRLDVHRVVAGSS